MKFLWMQTELLLKNNEFKIFSEVQNQKAAVGTDVDDKFFHIQLDLIFKREVSETTSLFFAQYCENPTLIVLF